MWKAILYLGEYFKYKTWSGLNLVLVVDEKLRRAHQVLQTMKEIWKVTVNPDQDLEGLPVCS